MRILCISDAWLPQINGVVRTYQNLEIELRKMGHDFDVIGPDSFRFTIPAPTYPEIRLAPVAYRTLPKMIDAAQADVIHIATEGPLGWAARNYCLRRAIPFSTCYHTRFPDYLAKRAAKIFPFLFQPVRKAAAFSIQKFHEPAKVTMVSTRSLENELRAQGYRNKFHRFSRGVDTSLFKLGEKTCFNTLKRPVALYVGRVAIEKNIETFLDAPWHGSKVVVGRGPALDKLKQKYPDVLFTGLKEGEDLAAHYRSGDIFAFPSQTETFGVVLLEAAASGLPVAACPVSGPADILTEPFMGVLDQDFSQALLKAASTPGNPEQRSRYITASYTWEKAARQFLNGISLCLTK
jgi:glycosyltransferase involved in cell wall biosynthesis